jgi:hypothetical protein
MTTTPPTITSAETHARGTRDGTIEITAFGGGLHKLATLQLSAIDARLLLDELTAALRTASMSHRTPGAQP